MSQLNVDTIKKADGTGSLTVPAETGTVVTTASPSLGRRNLIINGAMQVAQRGTQVTGVTTDGYKTCDRFVVGASSLGTWTVDQSTDSPDGFSNSFKMTATTADASPASGDYALLGSYLEAQDLQHLGYGTSNAKTMTLSFWVKSNKTGDASLNILQDDNSNKLFSNSYTINTADTWEYKTIAIPADTAGVINNDNGRGLSLTWWLNSGSTFSGGSYATTWSSYVNDNRNVSNLAVGGATSDYFAITGVQLEVGSVASSYEHRSFGEELALCQRYFATNDGGGTGVAWFFSPEQLGSGFGRTTIFYPVEMRANPTISNLTYANSSYSTSGAQNSLNRLCFTAWLNGMTNNNELFSWTADAEL